MNLLRLQYDLHIYGLWDRKYSSSTTSTTEIHQVNPIQEPSNQPKPHTNLDTLERCQRCQAVFDVGFPRKGPICSPPCYDRQQTIEKE